MVFGKIFESIEKLSSRYLVNHFLIGYFALFIILDKSFTKETELLLQIILAIIASYILFLPARIIVRIRWGEKEETKEAYTYYHFRIFTVFLFLSILELSNKIDRQDIVIQTIVVFLVTMSADLITWGFYRCWGGKIAERLRIQC